MSKKKEETNGGPSFSPGLFERLYEANVGKGMPGKGGGGSPIPRRHCTFVVDKDICGSDLFPEDFKLTIQTLSSTEETDATRKAVDPMQVGSALTRMSMYSVNGTVLKDEMEKLFLWEALGSGGRQVVIAMYAQVGMATEEALGKAQATFVIS